jgi:L-lactate dehydrogenase complex protein LldE
MMKNKSINVGLFVTCLADLFRPSVAFAAAKLIEDSGAKVYVPEQTCCGQPAYNAGARADTAKIARQNIERFEKFDYVVAPSGSCAAMISQHYPELFKDDPPWARRARDLGRRTFELTSFLHDVLGLEAVEARYDGTVTYHDSCSGLRELNVAAQPRQLLAGVAGLDLTELEGSDLCCGFGGTFCVKYGAVSNEIVGRKVASIEASGADTLLAGDLGCLMNMAGRLKRDGSNIKVRHVAEVLADMTDDVAPIGEIDGMAEDLEQYQARLAANTDAAD